MTTIALVYGTPVLPCHIAASWLRKSVVAVVPTDHRATFSSLVLYERPSVSPSVLQSFIHSLRRGSFTSAPNNAARHAAATPLAKYCRKANKLASIKSARRRHRSVGCAAR